MDQMTLPHDNQFFAPISSEVRSIFWRSLLTDQGGRSRCGEYSENIAREARWRTSSLSTVVL
jgi:hypothetical protein